MEEIMRDAAVRRTLAALRPDDDVTETLARVVWNVLVEPGDSTAGALLEHMTAADALRFALGSSHPGILDAGRNVDSALREARARWLPRADPGAVRNALRAAKAIGARLLFPGDAEWPARFGDLGAHAPVVLWARGDPEALLPRSVAIVGARASTGYGEHVTAELAGDLAASGLSVVSGGAYGIDGAAHRAALGVGGQTVAFLAGGVDRAYPAGHQELFVRIRDAGAVVSEVPCGTPPTRWRFLARNRLIAAAGAATVVVEAGWRSGSLNTAGHAAALGRPLGAVPGPITSAASAGCHRLLREYQARCVTSAAEVRELLGDDSATGPDESGAEPVHPDHVRLRDALSERSARSPADLARRSGLSVERITSILGMWALEGSVSRRDDGWLASRDGAR